MADHKTMIGGTAYKVGGGKCLVGGSSYSIKEGKTLIGGSTNDIKFTEEIKIIQPGKINLPYTSMGIITSVTSYGTQYLWTDERNQLIEVPLHKFTISDSIVWLPPQSHFDGITSAGVYAKLGVKPYAIFGPFDTTTMKYIRFSGQLSVTMSEYMWVEIGTSTSIPKNGQYAVVKPGERWDTGTVMMSCELSTTPATFEYTCDGKGIGTAVYIYMAVQCFDWNSRRAFCTELTLHS